MNQPKIAGKQPMPVELEAGKIYTWCSAGIQAVNLSATVRIRELDLHLLW